MATVSPDEKRVHYADNVDWEEEERRSAARAEKKREKKKSIKMAEEQNELRMTRIMIVISDNQNWHDLTCLCFSDKIIKLTVWSLVLGRGKCDSATLTTRLNKFAKKGHTSLQTLNSNQIEALETLNIRRNFTDLFRRQIAAATVVTSGSEEESDNVRRDVSGRTRRGRRRAWAQRQANHTAAQGDGDNDNPGGAAVIP